MATAVPPRGASVLSVDPPGFRRRAERECHPDEKCPEILAGIGATYYLSSRGTGDGAAVPRVIPISVIAGVVMVGDIDGLAEPEAGWAGSMASASPKSRTLTVPSSWTLMFAGFRSR
jgi:hypothetical protein